MKRVKRLFNDFKPESYDLSLHPDKSSQSFTGKVIIKGTKTGRPSKRITLHQKGLKVTSAKVTKYDKKGQAEDLQITRINKHSRFDEVRLHSDNMVYPGRYEIELEYSGKINTQAHGMYICNFKNQGKPDKLIATHLESNHAHEVFPCIDEPEAKAVFNLTLHTSPNETVISNTPIKSQSDKTGQLVTVFEPTPRMSTYLLAFAQGKLDYKESKSQNGVSIKAYATPANKKLLDYSLEVATKSVDFFEDYFGVPYPLPKLDLIALPDYGSTTAAMENWGLITFRESYMLVDLKNTSIESKQAVATVIAHEVSHMWFGNLVTMKWWDDLWLNESFANLMEYRAVDTMFPEWNIWEVFAGTETAHALRRDSLPNVQPVRMDVRHPDEIMTIFDGAIVYAKGGNLLNMLMNLIGEEAFRRGLKKYFEKHKYQNTTANDLWAVLGEESQFDIQNFMDSWLNKPGFPKVSVDYVPGSTNFTASQKRLLIGRDDSSSLSLWQVPLAASLPINEKMLTKKTASYKIDGSPDLLILNDENHSYFVPHYINQDHFAEILKSIKTKKLSIITRLVLLQNYNLLERAGVVSTIDNLRLLESYTGETDEPVWNNIALELGTARRLIVGDEKYESVMRKFTASLVNKLAVNIGWDSRPDDSPQTLRLRDLILKMAAGAEIPGVLKEGLKRFASFEKPSDLAPDIRTTVYFIGARFGSNANFEKLLKLHDALESADEKDELVGALTSTKDIGQLKTLIGMIKSDKVRLQDAPSWFGNLITNYYAADDTWDWLVKNWDWVVSQYAGESTHDLFARYAGMAFSRADGLEKYKKFFEPKMSDVVLDRTIKLGIEEIEGRVAWREKNESTVKKWLVDWDKQN